MKASARGGRTIEGDVSILSGGIDNHSISNEACLLTGAIRFTRAIVGESTVEGSFKDSGLDIGSWDGGWATDDRIKCSFRGLP